MNSYTDSSNVQTIAQERSRVLGSNPRGKKLTLVRISKL